MAKPMAIPITLVNGGHSRQLSTLARSKHFQLQTLSSDEFVVILCLSFLALLLVYAIMI